MKEVERLEPQEVEVHKKKSFLEQLEETYKDDFLPKDWSDKQKEKVLKMTDKDNTKKMIISAIPMDCKGHRCQFASTCELQQNNEAPVGSKCHPPGTLVYTCEHGEVPIEQLDPSIHGLYGFEKSKSIIRTERKKKDGPKGYGFTLHERDYCGPLIHFKTDNGSYSCTYDHLVIAKFNEKSLNKFCVYLMRKGDHWRIGKSSIAKTVKNKESSHKTYLGFPVRGSGEMADAMWILGVYDTNTEALLAEEELSLKFQVSKISFADSLEKIDSKYEGLYKWATVEQINSHHDSLIKDESFYSDLLSSFGLSIDYPIWVRNQRMREDLETTLYVRWPMYIRACNVIPGIMDMALISESNRKSPKKGARLADWETVFVERSKYCGKVYSLGVEKHKTYFAGKIATHNCPYEFALMRHFMADFIDQLGVDLDNTVEVCQVRDMVNQEVQMLRANKLLAQESFIQENAVGIDSDGDPIFRKELHLAVDLEDRLHKRRQNFFKQFLATREARSKAGVAAIDSAQGLADLMNTFKTMENQQQELLKKQLGIIDTDDYVEAKKRELDQG